eukprot:g8647.t1
MMNPNLSFQHGAGGQPVFPPVGGSLLPPAVSRFLLGNHELAAPAPPQTTPASSNAASQVVASQDLVPSAAAAAASYGAATGVWSSENGDARVPPARLQRVLELCCRTLALSPPTLLPPLALGEADLLTRIVVTIPDWFEKNNSSNSKLVRKRDVFCLGDFLALVLSNRIPHAAEVLAELVSKTEKQTDHLRPGLAQLFVESEELHELWTEVVGLGGSCGTSGGERSRIGPGGVVISERAVDVPAPAESSFETENQAGAFIGGPLPLTASSGSEAEDGTITTDRNRGQQNNNTALSSIIAKSQQNNQLRSYLSTPVFDGSNTNPKKVPPLLVPPLLSCPPLHNASAVNKQLRGLPNSTTGCNSWSALCRTLLSLVLDYPEMAAFCLNTCSARVFREVAGGLVVRECGVKSAQLDVLSRALDQDAVVSSDVIMTGGGAAPAPVGAGRDHSSARIVGCGGVAAEDVTVKVVANGLGKVAGVEGEGEVVAGEVSTHAPSSDEDIAFPEQKKYFVGMGNNNALIEQILQERGFTPAESPDRVMSKKPPPPPSFQWAQDHCRIDFTLLTPRFGTKTKHMLTEKVGMLASLEQEYGWKHPPTWYPRTFHVLSLAGKAMESMPPELNNVRWVYKPRASNCGRGIMLFGSTKELREHISTEKKTDGIVQVYIERPLLVGHGRKFDIRMYLLVARTAPFLSFFCPVGYCRLCVNPYESANFDDVTMHLTNQAIQKTLRESYKSTKEDTTWTFAQLEEHLVETGRVSPGWIANDFLPRTKQIMTALSRIIRNQVMPLVGCFDLFGCDFFLDDTMQLYLLD